MKRLILTADDFGLTLSINEAVERAARDGILTAASLIVGGDAAADAVERARRLPGLRVGLHLVLVNGRPVLPPGKLPALVGADGRFLGDLFKAGLRCFFLPGARGQIEAELRAQFEAFRRTGLPLDHVNAHCHFHLHPTVFGLILKVGRDYGMRALRLPFEPVGSNGLEGLVLSPWNSWLRVRMAKAGLRCNEFLLGMSQRGAMTEDAVLKLIESARALEGPGEIYFHPASRRCPELIRAMPDYDHLAELQALLSPRVRAALEHHGIERVAFGDLS